MNLGRLFKRSRRAAPGRAYASVAEGMYDLYPDCTSMEQANAYAANLEEFNQGDISREEWLRREQEIEAEYSEGAQ